MKTDTLITTSTSLEGYKIVKQLGLHARELGANAIINMRYDAKCDERTY